jgi:hypothetical protein
MLGAFFMFSSNRDFGIQKSLNTKTQGSRGAKKQREIPSYPQRRVSIFDVTRV